MPADDGSWRISGTKQWCTNGDHADVITVFATVDQHELALDTRLAWTFSPSLSLQLYLQPLLNGADDFYENIFHELCMSYRPVKFEPDVTAATPANTIPSAPA